MTTRRVLILLPVFVILILVQSYFWVPSYDEQTRGNPARLDDYITASIGDASILNPILSSDTASSEIENMVFEGLLDRDEDLNFRGRVARSWELFEEAYFYVNKAVQPPDADGAGPEAVVALLDKARQSAARYRGDLRRTLERITAVELIPARSYRLRRSLKPAGTGDAKLAVEIRVRAPARIRLTLQRVDPELFTVLSGLLGGDYFDAFAAPRFVETEPALPAETVKRLADELLPAVEHNPVLIFHLRPGVRFHDGHEVDAHDVQFTYASIMDPRNLSPRTADYEPVKSVTVLDAHTVRIVYKRLYSPAIGTWGMGILPAHLLDREALRREAHQRGLDPENFGLRDSRLNRRPIGCGPFRFKEWKSDQHILLERFEDYWEGPPNYRRYVFRIIPDLLTQEMEFYAGALDSYGVEPHQVTRLKDDERFQSFSGTSFGYAYIGYNLRRPPFDDPRVRRALGMAIDVDKIINFVLYEQGERITGPFVKQTDFYDHGIEPPPYDPQGALALLAEAGWRRNSQGWLEKDGRRLQFTLITNSGNDQRKAILTVAQDAWKKLGIDVRTDLLEWSVFIQERVNKLDFDALVLGWQMGIDPDLYQIWHSSQTDASELNFVGFQDPEADRLIVRIRREYDHDRQVADCHRLHALIARAQPYTFLYVRKWTAVLDRRIVIRETDAGGNPVYRKITPTKTGNYTFHFNRWIKLEKMPQLTPEG